MLLLTSWRSWGIQRWLHLCLQSQRRMNSQLTNSCWSKLLLWSPSSAARLMTSLFWSKLCKITSITVRINLVKMPKSFKDFKNSRLSELIKSSIDSEVKMIDGLYNGSDYVLNFYLRWILMKIIVVNCRSINNQLIMIKFIISINKAADIVWFKLELFGKTHFNSHFPSPTLFCFLTFAQPCWHSSQPFYSPQHSSADPFPF